MIKGAGRRALVPPGHGKTVEDGAAPEATIEASAESVADGGSANR
jgi:hypothetical protein